MSGAFPFIFHEAALDYAARGWAVFPLIPRDKRPLIPQSRAGASDGGFHLATTDAAQINAWWRDMPNANIGLRCGAQSGVFVLDLDNDAAEAALRLLAASAEAELPDTLSQRTGKGRHLIFRHAPGVMRRIGGYLVNGQRVKCPGFDICGEGGYIILPPSIHPSGRSYAWDDVSAPIADAPAWLLDAIVPPPAKPATAAARARDVQHGRASIYGEKALDSACRRISSAAPGTQNSTLTSEAAAIGELVAGGEIERGYAEGALIGAALAMTCSGRPWLPDEVAKKVAWGFHVGAASPRSVRREELRPASSQAQSRKPAQSSSAAQTPAPSPLLIAPPDSMATLIVAARAYAEDAMVAWEASRGGSYGLFAPEDLIALAGGLAPNAGGYDDWRLPRADLRRPAQTMRWRGRVLIVLPPRIDSFTVSKNTKFERFISSERHGQVLGMLATHWWKQAGAADVAIAQLPASGEQAA